MGLRDRLRERQLPQATVGIRIDWSQRSYDLHRELELAQMEHDAAAVREPDSLPSLREKVAEAKAEVDALYEFLVIKAIPANELEALVSMHPPKDPEGKGKGASFDPDTFFPALLAACVESDEDEASWTELMSSGDLMLNEINVLISTAMQINDRSPSVTLGKGLTTTIS